MQQLFLLLITGFVVMVIIPAAESNQYRSHHGRKHSSGKHHRHSRQRAGLGRADIAPVDYCNRTEYLQLKQSCVETFTKPNITAKNVANIKWQNRQLIKKYTENAIESAERNDLTPTAGFLFLNISAGIYKRLCPNAFVPHSFITNVELLFKELHYVTTAHAPRLELIPVKETDRTVEILMNCLNETKALNYTGDDCQEEIATLTDTGEKVCPDLSKDFNAVLYDPLLDAIWHIYETVHSYCFPHFQNDNRMYHVYGYGFIDLFHNDIKVRWSTMFDNDDEFWERLIGPTWRVISMNVELCTQSVIQASKFPYRLGRETMPVQVRPTGFTGEA